MEVEVQSVQAFSGWGRRDFLLRSLPATCADSLAILIANKLQ
jgi:hypothetical protein